MVYASWHLGETFRSHEPRGKPPRHETGDRTASAVDYVEKEAATDPQSQSIENQIDLVTTLMHSGDNEGILILPKTKAATGWFENHGHSAGF